MHYPIMCSQKKLYPKTIFFLFNIHNRRNAAEGNQNSPEVLPMSGGMLTMIIHIGGDAVILHGPTAEVIGPWLVAGHLLLPLPGDGRLQ